MSESFIGNDTTSSINSGVQQGMIAEVKEVIDTFRKENKDTVVILTGGDCFFFSTLGLFVQEGGHPLRRIVIKKPSALITKNAIANCVGLIKTIS